jgi:hypothetical protein
MKKLILLAVFVVAAQASLAQAAAGAAATRPAEEYAVAEVDIQNFDFGKIAQGKPVDHEFTFVNKGKVPLIITNAQPTCGCTIGAWTKEPIPPGGTGFVKATFNASATGVFDKGINVTANVATGVIVLRIRGEVLVPTPN